MTFILFKDVYFHEDSQDWDSGLFSPQREFKMQMIQIKGAKVDIFMTEC